MPFIDSILLSAMPRQHALPDNEDNYVDFLKKQVDKLTNEVRTLKSRAAYGGGRRGSLRELRTTYKWSEDDLDCSEQVMRFCSEYLFPRYKFLEPGWIVHDPTRDGMSFSLFVKKHLPLPDNMVFEEKWDNLIAPTIVKKYTDMRCNVNSFVRNIYLCEYDMVIVYYISVNLVLITTLSTRAKWINAMEEIYLYQKSCLWE